MSEKNSEVGTQNEGPLKLDLPTIETRMVHYPEELQEPVLWLASYLAKECRRDLDVLCAKAKKLGIEMDKTTWARIVRGRWNQDSAGRETKRLVNADKLLKSIRALREDARLKELAGRVPFVETSRAKAIFEFMDGLRAPERVNKFGIIVGRSGTEKTSSTTEYCRRANADRAFSCVHMESPARPSLTQFVTDLARAYECRNSSWGAMQAKITDSVDETRTIVLENVQRLYVEKAGAEQPVFNFLQKLQDDTNCAIVLTLTPHFAKTLVEKLANGYFEQFIGRAGGVHEFMTLPHYATEEDVVAIAESFGLQHAGKYQGNLVKLASELGLIRVLFGVLQKAKVVANNDRENLSIEHVKDAIRDETMIKRIFGN